MQGSYHFAPGDELRLPRPDDWHLHLRDGKAMAAVLRHSARQFGRAIVMPNLAPPVVTTEDALAYRERILAALPSGSDFEPLMTLYLTDETPPGEIERAKDTGRILACKLYPAGATTNSSHGVTDLARIYPCLERMRALDMPLLLHGEVTDPEIDIFEREAAFIRTRLSALVRDFPGLKIVLEHVTTAEGVEFVRNGPETLAATITPQHLLYSRNALLVGGIRPHLYCLPILKRERHRQALLEVVASGHPRFFLGTDSAPHATTRKESACGCAGVYSAHAALELYAEAFEQVGALERLGAFAGRYGAAFYGLPEQAGEVVLRRESWTVPDSYDFGGERITGLKAGACLHWRLIAPDSHATGA